MKKIIANNSNLSEFPMLPAGVKEVSLFLNNIKKLPPELRQHSQLKILNVSANQLKKLPKGIGNLKRLWMLDLGHNQILSVPKSIGNLNPIVGPLGVNYNHWEDADMYYKGSWMIHTLRYHLNNDSLWWKSLYKFCEDYKISNLQSGDVISFFEEQLNQKLGPFFEQYLYTTKIPNLEYYVKKEQGKYQLYTRFTNTVKGFQLNTRFQVDNGVEVSITSKGDWQKITLEQFNKKQFHLMDGYYLIESAEVKP